MCKMCVLDMIIRRNKPLSKDKGLCVKIQVIGSFVQKLRGKNNFHAYLGTYL
jgi:hypothetical protein